MRIVRLSLMLLTLPFLAGCLSMTAINSANYPGARVVPDRIRHIERAGISKDNQLLILLVGSITNSPRNSHFTLTVPLSQIETRAEIYSWHGKNGLPCAGLSVPRSAIAQGWPRQESFKDFKPVPIGLPISPRYGVYPSGFAEYTIGESPKALHNSTQTLYQVRLPRQMEFIFIDASDKRASTDLRVTPLLYTPKKDWKYYFLLPVTVPLDVATAPVQIPFIIFIGYAMGHSGC